MTASTNLQSNHQEPQPSPQRPLLRIVLLSLTLLIFAWFGARAGQWLSFPGSTWVGLFLGILFGVGWAVDESETRRLSTVKAGNRFAGPELTGQPACAN
jgi:hypothetical protein